MSSSNTVGSVVIPAHNESAVIARCLHNLFDGVDAGDLEVVVVCNGCQDDTAAVARATGHPIEVVELAVASKAAALRAGDGLLHAFPRLYLDADVVLPGRAAVRVLEHLTRSDSVAARPPARYETAHSSAFVRRYYRARSHVPAVMGSIWGAGVYGLSASGRARFGNFPDLVADDLFVDQCFGKDEIDIVGDEQVVVMAPTHYFDLLKVMRRAYRGVAETLEVSGDSPNRAIAPKSTTASTLRDVMRLCRSLSGSVDAVIYAFVAVSARAYMVLGRSARWERDESSRGEIAPRPNAGSVS